MATMALKNTKLSNLTRTLTAIPLAGTGQDSPSETEQSNLARGDLNAASDGVGIEGVEQGEISQTGEREAIACQDRTQAKSISERLPANIGWQLKFDALKRRISDTVEKFGLWIFLVAACLFVIALICSTLSIRHLKSGKQLVQDGYYARALPELSAAMHFNPNSVAALYARGFANEKLGNLKAALADYNKAIKVNPFFKDVYAQRANIYKKVGDYESAAADYTSAIAMTANPPFDLFAHRAESYYEIGNYKAALSDFDAAISHASRNASLYLGRCQCFIRMKEHYEDGVKDCNAAIELEPRNSDAYAKRAWCNHFLGNNDLVAKDINLALEINPNSFLGYYYRGVFALRQSHPDKALADLDQAIKLNSAEARAYLVRAQAYNLMGEKRKAINDFEKALELGPLKHGDIVPSFVANLCAQTYIDIADFQSAANKLCIVIANSPPDAKLLLKRAKCYMHAGNYQAALKDLDAALALQPDNGFIYGARANCNNKLGREVSAAKDFDKALTLAPHSAELYLSRGDAYFQHKDYSRANEDYRQALKFDARSAQAKAKLAASLEALHTEETSASVASQNLSIKDKLVTPKESLPAQPVKSLSSDLNSLISSGYSDLTNGKIRQSLASLGRAVQLYPNDARARRYLGYALLQYGQPLGAAEQFGHLAELGGQTLDDKLSMSQALSDGGKAKEAVALCKSCLQANPQNVKVLARLAHVYVKAGSIAVAKQVCRDGIRNAKTTAEQEELEAVLESIIAPPGQMRQQQPLELPRNLENAAHDMGG